MNKKSISIKEIAKLANTSVATVSRVINHNGRFSKDTEERILRIMEEHGYQPNIIAKALRENKTNLIGVMLPDITQYFFAEVYRAIELELYKDDFLPVLCDTNEDDFLESIYIDQLNNFRFAGLICLNGTRHNIPDSIPVLYVDRYPVTKELDSIYYIGSNNFQGGYEATKVLISSERKRLAIITHNGALQTQNQRYQGFLKALSDNNLKVYDNNRIIVNQINLNEGLKATKELFETSDKWDGIFYTSDVLAIGGLTYLRDAGYLVPDDISIIGYDNIPISNTSKLSTINQDAAKMGKLSAKSILNLINEVQTPKTQILDVDVVIRGTT